MSERAYPLTEEQQLKQRILTPQPARRRFAIAPCIRPSSRASPLPPPSLPAAYSPNPANCPTASPTTPLPAVSYRWSWSRNTDISACWAGVKWTLGVLSPLRKISGSALPVGLGQLALRAAVLELAATAVGSVAGALLTGLVALAWPSALGDSALYSDEQLRSMQRARSTGAFAC